MTQNKSNAFLEHYHPSPIKFDLTTGGGKSFSVFQSQNKQIHLTSTQFKKVIEAINAFYIETLLESGNIVVLPNGLGKIMIQKNKRRVRKDKNGNPYLKAPVNWAESYKQGKVVHHLNESTNGFTYRYLWFKSGAWLEHHPIWCMTMTGYAKKALLDKLNTKEKDYQGLYKELNSARTNRVIKRLLQ